MAHDLLDRDDPRLDPYELDQQRDLRCGAVPLGARLRELVRLAARVEVAQAEEAKTREEQDVPGEIVERLVEETEVGEAPAP